MLFPAIPKRLNGEKLANKGSDREDIQVCILLAPDRKPLSAQLSVKLTNREPFPDVLNTLAATQQMLSSI